MNAHRATVTHLTHGWNRWAWRCVCGRYERAKSRDAAERGAREHAERMAVQP